MSNYNISPALNKNKVFLINLSELLGRLDPAYNIAIRNSDLPTKYPTEQIGKLVKSFSGGTPSKANPAFWEGNILWASPKDFKDFYLTDTEDRISENALSDSSTTLAPANSLLIVVRSGVLIHTIPVAIAKLPMAINQDLKALIPDDRILPEYLGIYFRIYNDKLLPLIVKHSTTVQSINTEQFSKLKIPIPPKNIQQQIIAIYGKALQIKKQNDAAAEKLLASIDDYLLKELGITLPAPHENCLKNRMFTASIRTISGDRFDPLYWEGSIYSGLEKTKFSFIAIKEFVKYLMPGFAAGHSNQNINGEGIIQIRPTNISENREFIFNRNIYIDFSKHENLRNELLVKGEVLFNNTNSQELVGKAIYYDLDGDYFCSNHITRVGLGINCNGVYLSAIFNLYQRKKVFFKSCINWNNQSGVNIDRLKKIKIPLPPINKQKEIAEHITNIRQQAQQLKEKTKEALSKASQEIEKILLA